MYYQKKEKGTEKRLSVISKGPAKSHKYTNDKANC
jgi:hypothetical protein